MNARAGTDRSPMSRVRHVTVPRDVADAVHDHLRRAGKTRREGMGFWAGVVHGTRARVEAGYVPRQMSGNAGDGLAVMVPGDELFRMNVWLHEHRLRLIAQVHSHPTDAYHSETDDDYAVITETGGLSIVVPDFAMQPFHLDRLAVYRYSNAADWVELTQDQVTSLITLEE